MLKEAGPEIILIAATGMLKAFNTILSLWPQAAHKENLNYSLNYLGTIFFTL